MSIRDAEYCLQRGVSVLLTGEAGTGKTFWLRQYCEAYASSEYSQKHIWVCATTGKAALNLKHGMTVHSKLGLMSYSNPTLSQWSTKITHQKQRGQFSDVIQGYKQLRTLVIDEVSMLSAQLLEMIDIKLRILRESTEPFGGVSLLLVGDFYQLPPIGNEDQSLSSKYVFEAPIWNKLKHRLWSINLTKVYRQSSKDYVNLCRAIRDEEKLTPEQKQILQKRIQITKKTQWKKIPNLFHLAYYKNSVNSFNNYKLKQLQSNPINVRFPNFVSAKNGTQQARKYAVKTLLSDLRRTLNMKPNQNTQTFQRGMRVTCVCNDPFLRISNGTTGTIKGFTNQHAYPQRYNYSNCPEYSTLRNHEAGLLEGVTLVILLDNGGTDSLLFSPPTRIERWHYTGKSKENTVSVLIKCFTWMPCYASTVHRVQGQTLKIPYHVNACDVENVPGMMYVAISRGQDLDNLYISNYKGHQIVSQQVKNFYQNQLPQYTRDKALDFNNSVLF